MADETNETQNSPESQEVTQETASAPEPEAPAAGEGSAAAQAPTSESSAESGAEQAQDQPTGEKRGGAKAYKPRSTARAARPSASEAPAAAAEGGEVEEAVVKIYRCAAVVKGGRRFSFAALVVAGDRNGRVGLGYGKANEVPNAVEKATKSARRNMRRIRLEGTTIPHQIRGRFGASKVELIPAVEGTGVIAGASVRAVLELAGVKDVLTKCHGSTSPKNLVKAAFEGLTRLRSKEDIEKLREVSLA